MGETNPTAPLPPTFTTAEAETAEQIYAGLAEMKERLELDAHFEHEVWPSFLEACDHAGIIHPGPISEVAKQLIWLGVPQKEAITYALEIGRDQIRRQYEKRTAQHDEEQAEAESRELYRQKIEARRFAPFKEQLLAWKKEELDTWNNGGQSVNLMAFILSAQEAEETGDDREAMGKLIMFLSYGLKFADLKKRSQQVMSQHYTFDGVRKLLGNETAVTWSELLDWYRSQDKCPKEI